MSYNALDVAKDIVVYCREKDIGVSNLKLQKLLYYAWIGYYHKTHKYLFNEQFEAWTLGPVIPNVYNHFCRYGSNAIYEEIPIRCKDSDYQKFTSAVSKYIKMSSSELTKLVCMPEGAWYYIKNTGHNRHKIMPFTTIISIECDEDILIPREEQIKQLNIKLKYKRKNMTQLKDIIKTQDRIIEKGYHIENNIIESVEVSVLGHFGNAVSFRIFCHDAIPLSLYDNTANIGYLIKAFTEFFDLASEDGRYLSSMTNIPCRLVIDAGGHVVGFGHFMKDKFVLAHEFIDIGIGTITKSN